MVVLLIFGLLCDSGFFEEIVEKFCSCDFFGFLVDEESNVFTEAGGVVIVEGFRVAEGF